MIQNVIKRISDLLVMEEDRPERDSAGVCIPQNMDSVIRKKALKQCLQIIREELK